MDMDKFSPRNCRDFYRIPNYVDVIDPKIHELGRIVEPYNLQEMCPCALCGTPHRNGYLITLADGRVSNIGNVCGTKNYGEKFEAEERRYTEQVLRPAAIKAISEAIPKLRQNLSELDALAREADELSSYKTALREQFPELYRALQRRAASGDSRVVTAVERTRQDIENLRALNPTTPLEGLRYKEVEIGALRGLKVIEINLHEKIVTGFVGKGI